MTTATLAEREAEGARNVVNLTDGHFRVRPTNTQAHAFRSALEVVGPHMVSGGFPYGREDAWARQQRLEYTDAFLRLAGQSQTYEGQDLQPHLAVSSTISIAAAAFAMYEQGCRRLAVIRPAFDNVVQMVRDARIETIPVPSDKFWTSALTQQLMSKVDGIFFIAPNNPDGVTPTEEQFRDVMQRCCGKFVLGDFSFRMHMKRAMTNYDQYQIASEAGAKWVFVEDTGKWYGTLEKKTGIGSACPELSETFWRCVNRMGTQSDLLTVAWLKALVDVDLDAISRGETPPSEMLIHNNQQIAAARLAEVGLADAGASGMPVKWLRLPREIRSSELVATAARRGVAVLTGHSFFWDSPLPVESGSLAWHPGDEYVRASLARGPDYVNEGLTRFANAVREMEGRPLAEGPTREVLDHGWVLERLSQ